MGNFNPNYFDRKSGSLERAVLDAVNGVRTQINEASVTTDLDDDPKLFKKIVNQKNFEQFFLKEYNFKIIN